MVVLPPLVAMPVAIPVDPIVAIVLSLLTQAPPLVASVKDIDRPVHTLVLPIILAGTGFIVTSVVARQPVGNE